MTSFGWKRKTGAKVVRTASQAFEKEAKDELDNEVTKGEVDWLTLAPKRRLVSLEDPAAKSKRLSDEASILAGAERYWEAIKKWDEAILLTPHNSQLLEMKAQALMAVGEVFPAVQAALQAVRAAPAWWVAWQTLGRAQLNMGELKLAIRSFSKAVHLNPSDKELWEEDLKWACSVRDRSEKVANFQSAQTSCSCVASNSSSSAVERRVGVRTGDTTDSVEHYASGTTTRGRDLEDGSVGQRVLSVPSNYVHLRG